MTDYDDSNTRHETQPDDMVIEGLRPPLTREQRRRRITITAVVIAGALLVLLWPAISTLGGDLPSIPLFAQATATPDQSARVVADVTAVVGITGGSAVGWQSHNVSAVCPVTPQTTSALGLPEIQANWIGGEVWALLLTGPTVRANTNTVIVWRATGDGAFQVVANGPDATQLPPASGPDPHGGSNWDHPGEEWETTFTFPQPGCWQLYITRGNNIRADLWLLVSA